MRKLWIIALAVLVIGLAASVLFRDRQPQWTTSSPEALAAFEQGLNARMSLYMEDAASFYSKAVELDPDFVAAKLGLLNSYYEKGEDREDLLRDLEAADLIGLTPRETFLVRFGLAKERGEPAEAQRILEEYLDRYPRDPFALSYFGEEAWQRVDLQEAERRFRRLLEVNPNWVMAQNRLGYLAMGAGRFDEAEDLFHTYKYIAPDQANPYDSLGELLILVGRYDEAREELEQALEIKPDFCASYKNLLSIVLLEGPIEAADGVLERAARTCPPSFVETAKCQVELWKDALAGNLESPWQEDRAECTEKLGDFSFLLHRMELLTGRREAALAREERVRIQIEEFEERTGVPNKYGRGLHHLMQGSRLVMDGRFGAAAEQFREADEEFLYWGRDGILKLMSRMYLARALEQTGDQDGAQRVRAEVDRVNPRFADDFQELQEMLGLR